MRPPLSALVFLIALVLGLGVIFWLGAGLPDRVATHFNAAGQADGWMPRGEAIKSFALFAAGISLLTPVLMFCIRFLPARLLNVPRKEYWTRPENYRAACVFLFRSSLWFATLGVIFATGSFVLLVQANQSLQAVLNNAGLLALTALYLGGLLAWIVWLVVYFTRERKA